MDIIVQNVSMLLKGKIHIKEEYKCRGIVEVVEQQIQHWEIIVKDVEKTLMMISKGVQHGKKD